MQLGLGQGQKLNNDYNNILGQQFHDGLRQAQNILWEAVPTALAAESRRYVAADLGSAETWSHNEEQVCCSQWPNANRHNYKFWYHFSKHAIILYYASLLSFLNLSLYYTHGSFSPTKKTYFYNTYSVCSSRPLIMQCSMLFQHKFYASSIQETCHINQ